MTGRENGSGRDRTGKENGSGNESGIGKGNGNESVRGNESGIEIETERNLSVMGMWNTHPYGDLELQSRLEVAVLAHVLPPSPTVTRLPR